MKHLQMQVQKWGLSQVQSSEIMPNKSNVSGDFMREF